MTDLLVTIADFVDKNAGFVLGLMVGTMLLGAGYVLGLYHGANRGIEYERRRIWRAWVHHSNLGTQDFISKFVLRFDERNHSERFRGKRHRT